MDLLSIFPISHLFKNLQFSAGVKEQLLVQNIPVLCSPSLFKERCSLQYAVPTGYAKIGEMCI